MNDGMMDILANEERRTSDPCVELSYKAAPADIQSRDGSYVYSEPEFGTDGKIVDVTFDSSQKFVCIIWALVAGTMHLIWVNSAIMIGPTIGNLIPGYSPASIWMPVGSIASLCGNLTYYFIPRPIRMAQMIVPSCILMSISFVIPMCLNRVVEGTMSQSTCTLLVSIVYFLMEYIRGFVASQYYGIASFFRAYGAFAQSMNVAISVGEGVAGIVCWIVYYIYGGEMKAIWVSSAVNMFVVFTFAVMLYYVMSVQKPSAAVFKATCESNDAIRCATPLSYKVETLFEAFKGTKKIGFSLSLCFASTLNIYPLAAPLGFDWVSMDDACYLLGLFTFIDPIFRCVGFVFPKIMKGRIPSKNLYLGLVTLKTLTFLPACLIPYFADEAPWWMCTLSQELVLILGIAISQGFCVVLGIYTYFSHLPITENGELASLRMSLVTLYIMFGVIAGQVLFLIYPALR